MTAKTILAPMTCLLVAAGCAAPPASFDVARHGTMPPAGRAALTTAPAPQPRALPEKAALSDYLAYAALNNPGLAAAFHQWKAALERVPQAKSLPDPRFTYQHFIESVETRVGPQQNSFALAQTFPWFGKLALRGGVAAEAAEAERQKYVAAKLELFHRVKNAYYEHYYLGRAIAVTQESVRLVERLEALARARYRAAAGSHPDVIRAQVELGKLSDRLASLKDFRGPVVAKLNAALNRPPAAPLPEPPEALEAEKVEFTEEQLLSWLPRANPELKGLDAEIGKRRRAIELARRDYFPDVTFGLTWIDTGRSIGGRHPDDDGKDPLVAMVSVNLPVWPDKLAAGVREARARLAAAVSMKAQKTNSLLAELKMALFGFRDAGRKIDLYRDTLLPKARQSFNATGAAYRAGTAGFSDLIDAERVLLEFELAAQRALADRAQRLAELEMLVGREVPRTGGQSAREPLKNGTRTD